MRTIDDSISIGQGFSRIVIRESGGLEWTDGEYVTPNGIVIVQAQGGDSPFTRLDFALNGTLYKRTFGGKNYKPRHIARLAIKFAAETAK